MSNTNEECLYAFNKLIDFPSHLFNLKVSSYRVNQKRNLFARGVTTGRQSDWRDKQTHLAGSNPFEGTVKRDIIVSSSV